jgi:hypothetical protein
MTDLKKMDEKDFVFLNKKLTNKEEQDFSAFLKSRKSTSAKVAVLKRAHQ